MNIRSKTWLAISFVLIAAMLAACTTPTPEVVTEVVTQVVTQEVVTTQIVNQTVEVQVTQQAPESTRTGGWLDRIVFVEEGTQEGAVTRLQSGDLDVYAFSADDPNVFQTVKEDPNLNYVVFYGSSNEMTFNISPFTDGSINPFSSAKIREATNMLVDRNYIVQEIAGGLGLPKTVALNGAYPDYARFIDTIRELEAKYAYDPAKADEWITPEMEAMGASKNADGKWVDANGDLVTLKFIIRIEDSRKEIGDYFASQLESVGFTVDRQYKNRTEAAPIWIQSDPAEGLWHIYTGGWIGGVIDRNDVNAFGQYYTNLVLPYPLFQLYDPGAELFDVINRIYTSDYASIDERADLYRQALVGTMEYATRIWIMDQASFSPFRSEVQVTGDLAGGISYNLLYPYTLRFKDQEGGSMTIANAGQLVEPWNPVAGSNQVYDQFPQRATEETGFVYDPFTGLQWNMAVDHADVVVKEGLPVNKTLDWVNLEFAPEITVPDDVWVDWDPVNQKFITASEKFTETQTALTKSTVYYPDDFMTNYKWHDGSNITVGDFVMFMIMNFDPGKEGSPIFDEAQVGSVESFLTHFKGVKIVSEDPLVIETYDDQWQLDAEYIPRSWFPTFQYGSAPWTGLALGMQAEINNELAFSADKATAGEVEQTSYVSGPSLEILTKYLDSSVAEGYLPYAPTMSEFVDADEIAARWKALDDWHATQGHFWVGTGPYYLDKVFPVEHTLTLLRFEDYPYPASRWARFGAPKFATVELDGPGNVTIGQEATFDVFVTNNDEPYPAAEIDQVKWLLFDATNTLVGSGDADAVSDGQYSVTLTADQTGALSAGSNRLEVAVTSNVIGVPGLGSLEFVTTAP